MKLETQRTTKFIATLEESVNMAYALNFDRKLQQRLIVSVPEYTWETGRNVDKRSKVDVVGLKSGVAKVLIEIELKKDNPVENVVKIWRWVKAKKIRNRLLFLHAFSSHYLSTGHGSSPAKAKQYDRAVFVGEQMQKDNGIHVSYKVLPIRTTTRKGYLIPFKPLMRRGVKVRAGGGAMLRAADNLGQEIAKLLRDESCPRTRAIQIE